MIINDNFGGGLSPSMGYILGRVWLVQDGEVEVVGENSFRSGTACVCVGNLGHYELNPIFINDFLLTAM